MLHGVCLEAPASPEEGIVNEHGKPPSGELVGKRPSVVEVPPELEHLVFRSFRTVGHLLSAKVLEGPVVVEGKHSW